MQAHAEAERVMAAYRLQQAHDTVGTRRSRTLARAVEFVLAAVFGFLGGALLGAPRGHALAAGLATALVGVLLALLRQRSR